MHSEPRERITDILSTLAQDAEGDGSVSLDRLMPLVYDELRAMAGRRLQQEHRNPTLSPTELVHEAYVRLADATRVTRRGRAYFFAAAARAMRQIVVDHARSRGRAKRGGGVEMLTLNDELALTDSAALDVLELEEGLEGLAQVSERGARVVECRFYGGLSVDETADALGVTSRTVNRDWQFARAWLFDHLRRPADRAAAGASGRGSGPEATPRR